MIEFAIIGIFLLTLFGAATAIVAAAIIITNRATRKPPSE